MTATDNIKFSDETLALVERIIRRYPTGRQKSALLPVLHLAQAEFDGWLSAPVMDYVASLLDIPLETGAPEAGRSADML